MRKIIFASAVVAASVATPAFAQDAEGTTAANGVRVEAIVGFDRVMFDMEDIADIDNAEHLSGIIYGIGIGYDIPLSSNISVGVDLEGTMSTANRTEEGALGIPSLTLKAKAGRDLYAGIRMTAAVSPKINFYVKGGYTNARGKVTSESLAGETSESANSDGFRVGTGLQYAMGQSSYIGLEARYSNYEADVSRMQVAATVGFRF